MMVIITGAGRLLSGYVFDDTANSIEAYYRGLSSSDTENYTVEQINFGDAAFSDKIKYDLETGDLMLTQFVNMGDFMQMRFLGGLSYLFLERKKSISAESLETADTEAELSEKSKFSGFGPRVGVDARYDFGGDGFGIVGGASLAYFLGTVKTTSPIYFEHEGTTIVDETGKDQDDNHNVTNLRANLAIDYVYYMDEDDHDYPTFGIELGYQVDYYADAILVSEQSATGVGGLAYETSSVSFSGPYLDIKAAF